ncbi:ead/Ea22-like family protein [Salmonella enterica]|uniref:ead/Ea22-like family protein n=1 Tax=Salmonella enterica TaxID=28901 RepID=UPI000BA8E609|nr:ead/Ea22-like family protein [Salmonella enterica]EBV7378000.1 ead/Ea22-like family protein [Salmonella enterica subsp. enterica serovar Gaminara]EAM2841088.1 ead/Ea22-like family protein [Salmonella enterica]EAP3523522.1 ead/Ea22-like family protein [Salmonella enterica]EAX1201286.1 ead/Ea22-like family protein [Salmonella enterica]EBA5980520.1 ead/Ea22-like family protein [Salmonella enterica]
MTIDKQALRQIAESVDREEWDVLDNGDADYQVIVSGSLERGATYRSYQPVTNEISNKKIAAFIAAFNPKVALALLDELDKKQQYIKLRDQENEDIALTVGKLRVELEHYKSREERVTKLVLDNSTSWDVLYEKLEAAERRIAELEARAVNLPKRSVDEVMHLSGFSRDYAEGWCAGNDNAIHEIRAAGIKVKES